MDRTRGIPALDFERSCFGNLTRLQISELNSEYENYGKRRNRKSTPHRRCHSSILEPKLGEIEGLKIPKRW